MERGRFRFRIPFAALQLQTPAHQSHKDRDLTPRRRLGQVVIHDHAHSLVGRDIQAVVKRFEGLDFIVLSRLDVHG